jgi:hypothetical protein
MSPPSLRGGLPPREVEDIVLANSIRRRQGRHLLVAAKGRAMISVFNWKWNKSPTRTVRTESNPVFTSIVAAFTLEGFRWEISFATIHS